MTTEAELKTPAPNVGAGTAVLTNVPVGDEVDVYIDYTDQIINSVSDDVNYWLRRHQTWVPGDQGLNPIPEQLNYRAELVGGRLRMRFVMPHGQLAISQIVKTGAEYNAYWGTGREWSTDKSDPDWKSLTLMAYSENWDAPKPDATMLQPEVPDSE